VSDLTCYTGVMGAGKTYRLASLIKNDFSKSGLVLTNINGIHESDTVKRVDFVLSDFRHFDSDEFGNTDVDSPFLSYVLSIRKKYALPDDAILYICIDEAQNFYKGSKDNAIFYSIEKCRHYGVQFHLTCQDIKALPKRIYDLCEVEQRAIPARYCIPGLFGYKQLVKGQMTGTKWMLKRASTFAFYKSQEFGKPKKQVNILFVGVLLVGCYAAYFMYGLVTGGIFADDSKKDSPPPVTVASPPVASPAPSVKGTIVKALQSDAPVKIPDEPECALPEIVGYSATRDLVKYKSDDGFVLELSAPDFIDKFPPMMYCYSYFYCEHHDFIVLSQLTNKMIFPRNFVLAKHYSSSKPAEDLPDRTSVSSTSTSRVGSDPDHVSRSFLDDDTEILRRKYTQELEDLQRKYGKI